MYEQSLLDHWLKQLAGASADRLAVVDVDGARWTWARLAEAAQARARDWRRCGIGSGDRTAVEADHDAGTVVALHAAHTAGVAVTALDRRAPAPPDAERRGSPGSEASDLVVVSTSGTTGVPKGVRLGAVQVCASADAVVSRLGVGADDVWLCCLPLSHVSGQAILWRSVVSGCAVVMAPPGDTDAIAAAASRCTIASMVPTQLHRLLRDGGLPPRLRTVLLGGAAVPPGLVEAARTAGVAVAVSYGMSEMASTVAIDAKPLDGVAVRVDGSGTIHVGGRMRTPGYAWGGILNLDVDGLLRTGDVGCIDGGLLAVAGRRDDVFTCGGENISTEAVRAALVSHPAVASALVTAEPDVEYGAVAVAEVVLEAGAGANADDLAVHCRRLLPAIAVPRRFEISPLGAGRPGRPRRRRRPPRA